MQQRISQTDDWRDRRKAVEKLTILNIERDAVIRGPNRDTNSGDLDRLKVAELHFL